MSKNIITISSLFCNGFNEIILCRSTDVNFNLSYEIINPLKSHFWHEKFRF